MSNYQHIARRVFNRPHLVEPNYASVLIGALTDRLNVRSLVMPDGSRLEQPQIRAAAEAYEGRDRRIFEEVAGIAVIRVEGTLVHRFGHLNPYSGMTGYDGIEQQLRAALDDSSIRGILLDIDSPGGEVSGCFDLADFIYQSRDVKPIWAVADEMACSAAYALASSAERIVVPRTAQVGSVGVLTAHVDYSRMLDAQGVDVTLIFAGAHKVDGNPYAPLPEEVRSGIQADIDALYGIFTSLVARNRGISEKAARDTEARVYSGLTAGAVRFVDDVMPVMDILPAFDDYLRDQRPTPNQPQGSHAMNLFGFRGRQQAKAQLEELRKMEAELAAAAEDEEEPEAEEPEEEAEEEEREEAKATKKAEDAPDEEEAEEDEEEPVASAERLVAMCAEAKVPQLAHGMIAAKLTESAARSRIANASQLRDVFAAAGFPQLAGKAIETGMDAGFARTMLIELTAAASGEEVSHHQPDGEQPRKASINAAKFYKR